MITQHERDFFKGLSYSNAKEYKPTAETILARKQTSDIINKILEVSDYTFKIRIVGDYNVGKTSLMRRFAVGEFEEGFSSTASEAAKKIAIYGNICQLVLCEESMRNTKPKSAFYRVPDLNIICFDVNDFESFNNAEKWFREVKAEGKSIVVATKCDSNLTKRVVTKAHAEDFCNYLGLSYFETSAKDNLQIEELFQSIALTLLKKEAKKDGKSLCKEGDIGVLSKERLEKIKNAYKSKIIPEETHFSIIQGKVKEIFGEKVLGLIKGGHYQNERNQDIKTAVSAVLDEAKELNSQNLKKFIDNLTEVGNIANNPQSLFFKSRFSEDVKAIVAQYNSLKAQHREMQAIYGDEDKESAQEGLGCTIYVNQKSEIG